MSLAKRFGTALIAAVVLGTAFTIGQAADYPSGPVHIIVPYPAGGPADLVARTIAEPLSERLGEPVVVESRAGAGGNIGTDYVAKAEPDGHTLLLGTNGPLVVNGSLFASLPFEPLEDFAPITQIASIPLVLIAHPSVPADTVEELIELAKSRPGEITYASSGIGSGGHLAGALFASSADVSMVHVPYAGAAPSMTDLIGGHVDLLFVGLTAAQPHLESGKAKVLGVAMPRRATAAPDIPTIAESALPGFEITSWYGVLAPAGTPEPIIERLHKEIVEILATPEVHESLFVKHGLEPIAGTPQEFTETLEKEIPEYARIVDLAGAKQE